MSDINYFVTMQLPERIKGHAFFSLEDAQALFNEAGNNGELASVLWDGKTRQKLKSCGDEKFEREMLGFLYVNMDSISIGNPFEKVEEEGDIIKYFVTTQLGTSHIRGEAFGSGKAAEARLQELRGEESASAAAAAIWDVDGRKCANPHGEEKLIAEMWDWILANKSSITLPRPAGNYETHPPMIETSPSITAAAPMPTEAKVVSSGKAAVDKEKETTQCSGTCIVN